MQFIHVGDHPAQRQHDRVVLLLVVGLAFDGELDDAKVGLEQAESVRVVGRVLLIGYGYSLEHCILLGLQEGTCPRTGLGAMSGLVHGDPSRLLCSSAGRESARPPGRCVIGTRTSLVRNRYFVGTLVGGRHAAVEIYCKSST